MRWLQLLRGAAKECSAKTGKKKIVEITDQDSCAGYQGTDTIYERAATSELLSQSRIWARCMRLRAFSDA